MHIYGQGKHYKNLELITFCRKNYFYLTVKSLQPRKKCCHLFVTSVFFLKLI